MASAASSSPESNDTDPHSPNSWYCSASSFSTPDAEPPPLRSTLEKHLSPFKGCAHAPGQNPVANHQAKPWLHWPSSLDDVRQSDAHRELHAYLTSYKTVAAMTRQVREVVFKAYETATASATQTARDTNVAAFFQGGSAADWAFYASDCDKAVFRQEQFFRYLFGVNEPDVFGLLDFSRRQAVLFVPWTSPDYQRFMGPPRPAEWYMKRYGLDGAIVYKAGLDEIREELNKRQIGHLHVLRGKNSDSDRLIEPPSVARDLGVPSVDSSHFLYDLLTECRVHKTELEREYLRAACLVSSQGHAFVMRNVYAGMVEGQAEALFRAFVHYAGGARHVAYDCICCAGPHGAILHYGHAGRPNDGVIKPGDMLLFDMGGEYSGYSTDITLSYPVDGMCSPEQRVVYEAAYDAQRAVEMAMKPGVKWTDMHRLAEKKILERLLAAGVISGPLEACIAAHLGSVFMPHGLGHLLGLDTHDVGGFSGEFPRSSEPGLCYLRTTRRLEENMVITVEPGCYFVPFLIDKALSDSTQSRLINKTALAPYMRLGGVRLEDVVIVTSDGIENLTVVPRRLEEVEELLATRTGRDSALGATEQKKRKAALQ
ncbi:putative prolidase [Neospora caninum Liverpool]|uniref:Xaa-Pro dipeptidase n=1 Tax=Neospora caninum (strain Liverpool) TaxID=572307 RepID=F0VIG1_NEOCL|nr:putative prolidase [Neospora caninum Liverpool]CBZ53522.1 putative prolidase [Neospora caninum Liverpool]CEL67511.1 TPA: prolidase, putative [Neospora caninum Liverpool]|eukprot:XP_003883554.1 putative prolidase [Neospora caninum Liverpool]